MLLNCCTQYVRKFGELSGGQLRTGKGQFSSQSQRRAMPKDVWHCTIVLISHATNIMRKILQARLYQFVN